MHFLFLLPASLFLTRQRDNFLLSFRREHFEESDVEREARRSGRAWKDRYKEDKGDSFDNISGQIGHWKTKRSKPIMRGGIFFLSLFVLFYCCFSKNLIHAV